MSSNSSNWDKILNKKFLFLLQHKKVVEILMNNKLSIKERMKKVVEFLLSLGFSALFGVFGGMIPGFPLLGRSVFQWLGSLIFDSYIDE